VPPRNGRFTLGVVWRRQRVLKLGVAQSSPTNRNRLCTKPVVCRNGSPNSTFKVRQVWIAASLKLCCRPRLPVGAGTQAVSGSNQPLIAASSDRRSTDRQRSARLQAVIVRRSVCGLVLGWGPDTHTFLLSRWIQNMNPLNRFVQQSREKRRIGHYSRGGQSNNSAVF
jgi:hypothetical protein